MFVCLVMYPSLLSSSSVSSITFNNLYRLCMRVLVNTLSPLFLFYPSVILLRSATDCY